MVFINGGDALRRCISRKIQIVQDNNGELLLAASRG